MSALLLTTLSAPGRPPVAQQITWLYASSLWRGAAFIRGLGFSEVTGTKQAGLCRIFHAAPGHYVGVCDSRPAPHCPSGPEGSEAPPVTYTLVVPTIAEVDAWHAHLGEVSNVTTTTPSHSARFGCYAFNFYDTDALEGLGCYRFEVQSFEDPAWPQPECPPIDEAAEAVEAPLEGTGVGQQALPSLAATAESIGLWLRATALCDGAGACRWPMNSTDTAPAAHPYLASSLYYGPVGTALFLAQLANASAAAPPAERGREHARGGVGPSADASADAWRRLAAAALEATRAGVGEALVTFGSNAGLYYGLLGLAFGLRAAPRGLALPAPAALGSAAEQLEEHVLLRVAPYSANGNATLWNNTDVAHGAAGAGLYLLWAAALSPSASRREELAAAAARAGSWLLARAESAPGGGLRWARGADTDGAHSGAYYPTFCCGTAGVAHFLAALSQAPAAPALTPALRAATLGAALSGARHVLSLGDAPLNGTLLLPHEEEGSGRHTYYLGWCGGPAGWARLFVVLWRATRDPVWLRHLEAAARAVELLVRPPALDMLYEPSPAPPGRAPWANLGQCCGAAGAGTFLLQLGTDETLPLPASVKEGAVAAAMRLARAVASRAVPAAPRDEGRAVPSPEEHDRPADTRWQAGWMQGAAGVGSFLLHADAVAAGRMTGRRASWPDEPW